MNKPQKRLDIAVMRLFCIAVVVFFHAYGMMYATGHFDADVYTKYEQMYKAFNQGPVINLAMAIFTFIAGFLFGRQLLGKRYSLTREGCAAVFSGKGMRVLLPFFVFTIIFMFTTNSASWAPFYQWTYSHLWYLPMLFWCFVFTWILQNIVLSSKPAISVALLAILLVVSCLDKFVPLFLGLHSVSCWLYWFVLGAVVSKWESAIFSAIKRYHLFWGLVAAYVVFTILFPPDYGHNTFIGQITITCGVYAAWHACREIPWQNFAVTKFLVWLSTFSFGIYIFHNWLEAFIVSSSAQRLLPLRDWAINHMVLFPLVFSLLAFVLSFLLTWAVTRTRIGRKLIG